MLKVASFFAGIGGFDLGFEQAGMEVIFQCEINPFCQKVLRKHWSNVNLYGDIKQISTENIPKTAQVWCGGFPCQDLSLANQGKRRGLEGERSGLFYRYAELIAYHKPKWVIIENVPGLLNSHQGEDFRILVEKLDEFGYGVSWRVFDAKYFGTPQRRRRVYLVGSLGSLRSAQVLFESEPFAISVGQGGTAPEAVTGEPAKHFADPNQFVFQHAGIGRKPSAGPQAKGWRNDGESYTLDSRGSADAVCKTLDAFRVRDASGVSERLDGNRYRAVGNAVCVHVARWLGERIVAVDAEWQADQSKSSKVPSNMELQAVP
ncbi:MAG: DNA cytosine methyltransferase [Methylovulum sp.]|nr:DNA cytosine methyltransferase [Methylovulum sp.]